MTKGTLVVAAVLLSGCNHPVVEVSCTDKTRNGTETDVDCGGSCGPCATGKMCTRGTDCSSGVCTNNVCVAAAPKCTDGTLDGDETDVDCGGSCGPCANGAACDRGSDCQSGLCVNNVCVPPAPTCSDGVHNGNETGVDCGGSCQGCGVGGGCLQNHDCASNICVNDQCQAPPSCIDGVTDGTETDVDCGGACAGCSNGKVCTGGGDCASGNCANGHCAPAPTCTDMIADGTETDVDCGGSCSPCQVGKLCLHPNDCTTGFCTNDRCVTSCANGILDGNESSIDCGGSCGGCVSGQHCNGNSDCLSAICTNNVCVTPGSCSDGIKDGTESDVDCGGTCNACLSGYHCNGAADCVTSLCVNSFCSSLSPLCADDVKDGTETAVDCGGGCLGCAEGVACATASDCATGVCTNSVCAAVNTGVPPNASVVVLSSDGGAASLFVIGNDRALHVDDYLGSTGTWSGLVAVVADGGTTTAPPGAPLAGAQRTSAVDVFYVDDLGALEAVHLDSSNGAFNAGPIRPEVGLGGAGTAVPGSRPSVVVMFDNRIDVVLVDKSGELLQFEWTDAQGSWGPAVAISQPNVFALGTAANIVTTEPTRTEENFVIDSHGNVWDNWCDQGCPGGSMPTWRGGTFAQATFPIGAPASAFSITINNQDLLCIDRSGEVERRSWQNPNWGGFVQFSAQGTLSPYTLITYAVRNASVLDVFATDSSGAIRTLSWTGTWTGGLLWEDVDAAPWPAVLPPGTATPNSDTAALPNLGTQGALDLFWVAPVPGSPGQGQIWTMHSNGSWATPQQLY